MSHPQFKSHEHAMPTPRFITYPTLLLDRCIYQIYPSTHGTTHGSQLDVYHPHTADSPFISIQFLKVEGLTPIVSDLKEMCTRAHSQIHFLPNQFNTPPNKPLSLFSVGGSKSKSKHLYFESSIPARGGICCVRFWAKSMISFIFC